MAGNKKSRIMIYDLSLPGELVKVIERINTLNSKDKKVEVKEVRERRSLKQNAFLHVCVSIFAIEFGYSLDEAKQHLKLNCHFMHYEKGKDTFIKKTSVLDSKELTDFIDWIRTYSGKLGLYIPTPEDYMLNRAEIDRQINQNKEYL